MIKFKDYHWVLDGLAALLLIVAFIMMIINSTEEIGKIIIQLTGVAVLFFTLMRIKPIISSRNNKDYVIVMFGEMLITLIVGAILLFSPNTVRESSIISFSRLIGIVLFMRGVAHFWTTSKRYELHDIISFIVHIMFISFGFLFLYSNNLKEQRIVITLIILSLLLSLFFGYRSYRGYNNYRTQKGNLLKMGDYLEKKEKEEKVIEDPKSIDEQINPKIIDEPNDENRPSIDIN